MMLKTSMTARNPILPWVIIIIFCCGLTTTKVYILYIDVYQLKTRISKFAIVHGTNHTLKSHFELCLQFVESCSHILKIE